MLYSKAQKIFAKKIPKQVDIYKLLKQLNRKFLINTRMPISLKDIASSNLQSVALRDVYQYVMFDKLRTNKTESNRVETLSRYYFILGGLLFKHSSIKGSEYEPLFFVPPCKNDYLLDVYHVCLLGGHQGLTITLRTLAGRFYCQTLADHVRSYIICCLTCQLFKDSNRFYRRWQKRYYDSDTAPLTVISMYMKHMLKSNTRMEYILLLICLVSNFIITHAMPLAQTSRSQGNCL